MSIGIKETKEVVLFGVGIAGAVDSAIADGFQWTDIFDLVPSLMKLPGAISGIEQVPAEIADMNETERAELIAAIQELDFKSEYSEEIVEQGLRVGLEIGKLVVLLRKARKV